MPQLDPFIINAQISLFIIFFIVLYGLFIAKVLPKICKSLLVLSKIYYAVVCTGGIMRLFWFEERRAAVNEVRPTVWLDQEGLTVTVLSWSYSTSNYNIKNQCQ